MNFHVGQKVVCVDDVGQKHAGRVERSKIYTVTGFDPQDFSHPEHEDGIYLLEVKRDFVISLNRERSFMKRRFRPLVTRKTSIEIFKKMLGPKQKETLRELEQLTTQEPTR